MSEARTHARNLLANWVGYGANMVVLFLLSPYVVHTLGEVRYGIWSLLMVLTGYMGMFDIGVRASSGRYIILYLGREDHQRLGETIRTSFWLFSILGALFLAAGLTIGFGFPHFFPSTPKEYHGLIAFLLPAMAVNVWFSVIGALFSSVLTAHDRFDLARSVDLGVLAIRTVGTIGVLMAGYGLVGLTGVTLACGLAALGANYVLARRVYPRLRVRPLTLVRSRLKELFIYGLWAALATNAYRIIGQTDLVIAGALIGVSSVTVYSVGAMLIYYSDTFLGKISVTFFPPLQRAAAREDEASVRWYYVRQLRLALACGIPMYVGFAVFGRAFIHLWMEDPAEFPAASVAQAAVVMGVLSAAKFVYLPAMGAEGVLAAKDRVRFVSLTSIVEALTNLGLSIFFVAVLDWGLMGVAAGTLAARLLVRAWVMPWQVLREVRLTFLSFLKVILAGMAVAGGFLASSLVIRWAISGASWPLFAVQVGLALVVYAPMAFFLLVPEPDRKRILHTFHLGPAVSD